MKTKSWRWALLAPLALFAGCVPPSTLPDVDYQPVSVAQESGSKFSRITTSNDGVESPRIWAENMYQGSLKAFAVSSDESKIAYVGYKEGKFNVYVKSLRGGNQITQRTFGNLDNVTDVAFSKDGHKIAFSGASNGYYRIFIMDAEKGSAMRQVTTESSNFYQPVFGPDGKNLYFSQGTNDGTNNLWSYDLDKASFTQYTRGFFPTFWSNPNKVVLSRLNLIKDQDTEEIVERQYAIWLYDLEDSQEVLIASSKERDFFTPSVSPDGERIVFSSQSVSNKIRNFDLYTINIDGSGLTRLTFHPGNDVCPVWSPSGKSVYFLSQRGDPKGNYNIWKMDVAQ